LIFPRGLTHVEPSSSRRSCDRPFRADIVPVAAAAPAQVDTPLVCRSK